MFQYQDSVIHNYTTKVSWFTIKSFGYVRFQMEQNSCTVKSTCIYRPIHKDHQYITCIKSKLLIRTTSLSIKVKSANLKLTHSTEGMKSFFTIQYTSTEQPSKDKVYMYVSACFNLSLIYQN